MTKEKLVPLGFFLAGVLFVFAGVIAGIKGEAMGLYVSIGGTFLILGIIFWKKSGS